MQPFVTSLTIVLTALAVFPSHPLQAANSPDSDSPCYMQTSSGRLINLAKLCPNHSSMDPSPTVANQDNVPEVAVDQITYHGEVVAGQVVNLTDATLHKVTIEYAIVDAQGKELETGFTKSQGTIRPGGAITFQAGASRHPGATAQILSVDWQ